MNISLPSSGIQYPWQIVINTVYDIYLSGEQHTIVRFNNICYVKRWTGDLKGNKGNSMIERIWM